MKKITIFALSILIFTTSIAFAQSVKYPKRTGIVKESTMQKDSKGKPVNKPLAGVKIYIESDAFNLSDANGTFTLTPKKTPFKITKVTKNNYTLLSPKEGTRTYGDNNEVLDILMVSNKNFNSKTDSKVKVATENNEKKKNESLLELQKRKDRGEITTSEYIRMHDSITKVYSDRLKTLIDYCEESAKRWFMGQEIIDQEIDDAIIKGENDKALSLIDSKGTTKQRIEEIEKSKAAYENHKKLAQQHDEIAEKHKEVYESQVKSLVLDHRNRANIKLDEGKYDEALAYLDTARVLQEEHFGLQNPDLALTYHIIGFVYGEQDNLDKAMEFFNKALKIREQVLDSLSPDLAQTYTNIGTVYRKQFELDEAEKWYDKALMLYDKALDIEDNNSISFFTAVAVLFENMGTLYLLKKDLDEAMKWQENAFQIKNKFLNPLSLDLAISCFNMGFIYIGKKEYDKALEWYNKGLKIQEQVLDSLSPDLADSYNDIGRLYYENGDYFKAMKFLKKALNIREQVLKPLSLDLAITYCDIGFLYIDFSIYSNALEYFKKALPGYIKAYGEENDRVIFLKQKIKELEEVLKLYE
ncbi:MAG: tetratricopeptide repeat protein [Bacteroidales bacterium]|nr:tetratricopeptide repeat protein [Bacteroidales bacterium]